MRRGAIVVLAVAAVACTDGSAAPSTTEPPSTTTTVLETTTGSSSEIWLADDGSLAMALIRGALPPEQWPGESQIVDIDGVDARVGPFEAGEWVVAWFEEPGERCDQYTLVFYPPVDPQEVRATIESMDRTAG